MAKIDVFNFFRDKNILVTGHTGFKGSWLTAWLTELGANVTGIARDPKNENDNFVVSGLADMINDIRLDIRDFELVRKVFVEKKPEIVFHLAAQPLVLESYKNPLDTFQTNLMGTVNILEAIRLSDSVRTGIMITTDKVYENKEWIWPYREADRLGGYDPYSGSKAAMELVISSYRNSFFNTKSFQKNNKSISVVRAGNVIGGGDWSENRIIPDCIRSFESGIPLDIRNPLAIRPWQYVLEPLFGYMLLAYKMGINPETYSSEWNFGPEKDNELTVKDLVNEVISNFGRGEWRDVSDPNLPHETKYLTLDITKAKRLLGWFPALSFKETIKLTTEWYSNYKKDPGITFRQIEFYQNKIKTKYGF